jgi:hypothetical protein
VVLRGCSAVSEWFVSADVDRCCSVSPRVDHEMSKRRVVMSTVGAAVALRDGNGGPRDTRPVGGLLVASGAVSVLAPGTSGGVRIVPSRSCRRRNCGTDATPNASVELDAMHCHADDSAFA